jgi:hypothetical protein
MSITITKVKQYSYNYGTFNSTNGYWTSNKNAWDEAGIGGS